MLSAVIDLISIRSEQLFHEEITCLSLNQTFVHFEATQYPEKQFLVSIH